MVPHRITSRRTGAAAALAAALCFLAAPAAAQVVPVVRADVGGLELWTVDEITGNGSVFLVGMTLEPIILSGFAVGDRLRANLPALEGTGSPAPRVRLPQGGALYRVRHGGLTSLLQLHADGMPELLLSIADVAGAAGLLPEITVARDGASALAASALASGGEVFLVDLIGPGGAVALNAALAPQAVAGVSLRLSGSHAWYVAGNDLYRVDVAAGGPAAAVGLALAPGASLLPELATPVTGSSVALLSEVGPAARQLWFVDPVGVATRLTTAPADIDTPALSDPIGPFVAVAPDGSRVAYRGRVLTNELFVCRTDLSAPAEQVTGDATFIDTIDNVGVIGFVDSITVSFAAGEVVVLEPDTKIGAADIYQASFAGGSAAVQNMTQSSGLPTPPFVLKGDLEVLARVLDPLAERVLLTVDPVGGDAALLSRPLDGSFGYTMLLPALSAPPRLTAAGDRVVILSQVDSGALPPLPTDLHLLHPAASPAGLQLVGTAPPGVTLDRVAIHDLATQAALVASVSPALEIPVQLDLASGAVAVVWNQFFSITDVLAFTPTGRLALGLGPGAGPSGPYRFVAFDAPQAGQKLHVPIGDGFPLPR